MTGVGRPMGRRKINFANARSINIVADATVSPLRSARFLSWPSPAQPSPAQELRELIQRQPAAELVVLEPHPRRNVVATDRDLGAAPGRLQRRGDGHLAGKGWIVGFEYRCPHDLLVGHE